METDLTTRTEFLMVRMTKEEKDTLAGEAQKLGISISAFIRLLLRNWSNGITFQKKKNGE